MDNLFGTGNNGCSDVIEWMFGDYNAQPVRGNSGGGSSGGTREGETGGGSLLKPISQFLCYIFDAIIDFLQDMFVTPERIKLQDGGYSIKYSPGVIFSGQVSALDINFIDPSEDKKASATYTEDLSLIDALDLNGATLIYEKRYAGGFLYTFVTKDGVIREIQKNKKYEYDETREIDIELLEGKLQSSESEHSTIPFAGSTWDGETNTLECAWYNENQTKVYIIVDYFKLEQKIDISGNETITRNGIIYLYKIDTPEALEGATGMTGEEVEIVYTKDYKSSAGVLQSVVATWYNALRKIALVGLLSAIVYIGIRIVLTSTSAKEKAKYKKMLKDWIIALCLLFTLHYIMSITITVVDKINEVIKSSSIAATGEDILMTSVRNRIYNGNNWSEVLTYIVIYSVLAVYTITYTIQYVRRVIYLAFLTMIAPLITLTYPLDKIKDSKSQAFDMWIKDYVFFSLIQVVHLLIYYIFLGSAIDLTKQGNWLFAIVAIGFITPAEKLIKKMFGFEKAKTLGAMGAGATGALVMNAMQKIPQGTAKGAASSKQENAEPTKPVRTAGVNPFATSSSGSSSNSGNSTNSSLPGGNSKNSGGANNTNNNQQKNQNTRTSQKQTQSVLGQLLNNKRTPKDSNMQLSPRLNLGRTVNGVKMVAGKYFAPVAGGTIRFMLSTTGAVIGVSTALAKGGSLSDIGTGIAVGTSVGKGVVNVVEQGISKVNEIPEKATEVVDTWREGAYGKEVAQNAKFDRVFRNSREYEDLKDSSGFSDTEFDKKVQTMLDEGIKDTKQMKKILKNHKKDPRKYSMENAIKYSKLAESCSEDILYDKVKFIRFCEDKKLGISEEALIELRKNIVNFK